MSDLLIVDDNESLRLNIVEYLEAKGYTTDNAFDGLQALGLLVTNHYDLIVLDWMLPGMDGITLLKEIRSRGVDTPVIVVSAKGMPEDRIEGLSHGADDYLCKPFLLAELKLRIDAILRRVKNTGKNFLKVGDLVMDLQAVKVSRADKEIRLNPTTFKILKLLMLKSPNIVTRRELENEIWGDRLPDSDSLRTQLHNLRGAIDKPFDEPLLDTVVGFGWALRSHNES